MNPEFCFPYKGKQLRPEELGRELGARYLVQGSVRRSSEHAVDQEEVPSETAAGRMRRRRKHAEPQMTMEREREHLAQVDQP